MASTIKLMINGSQFTAPSIPVDCGLTLSIYRIIIGMKMSKMLKLYHTIVLIEYSIMSIVLRFGSLIILLSKIEVKLSITRKQTPPPMSK